MFWEWKTFCSWAKQDDRCCNDHQNHSPRQSIVDTVRRCEFTKGKVFGNCLSGTVCSPLQHWKRCANVDPGHSYRTNQFNSRRTVYDVVGLIQLVCQVCWCRKTEGDCGRSSSEPNRKLPAVLYRAPFISMYMLSLLVKTIILISLISLCTCQERSTTLYIAGFFPTSHEIPQGSIGRGVLPAVRLALQHVNESPLFTKYKLDLVWNNTKVSGSIVIVLKTHTPNHTQTIITIHLD